MTLNAYLGPALELGKIFIGSSVRPDCQGFLHPGSDVCKPIDYRLMWEEEVWSHET